MSKVIIHDAVTGETIERPMTPEEEAQREADRAAADAAKAAQVKALTDRDAARDAAAAKLKALGLSDAELVALDVKAPTLSR